MKQKMFLIAVAILFAASTADSFAQLTKIWDRSNENLTFESICRPGKLVVVSKGGEQYLIDMTNGETIYTAQNTIFTNYWGDRFYVHESGNLNEYDVKTKELVKVVIGIPQTSDSAMVSFDYTYHSIIIRNANTRELLDSFKIPDTPDIPTYGTSSWFEYSNNGRYIAFHLKRNNDATQNNFLLYDRQTREIIMQKNLPKDNFLNYQFFNTKNHMAYVENIKLPEDDKAYSYIRIYDPDKREVVKNIKMSNIENGVFYFLLSQNDNYFIYSLVPSNEKRFYDIVNNKKLDFVLSNIPGPFYLDDSLYIAGSFRGYKFDWNVVNVEEEPNTNIPVIYPNPTTNSVSLNIDPKYFNGLWQLIDINGSVVLQGIILPNPNLQINIGSLPAQNYFLRIQKDNFTITYSILKI